jgi:hypothetical protein
MKLFTFVVEHKGASSVSQISAKEAESALREWCQVLGKKLGTITIGEGCGRASGKPSK